LNFQIERSINVEVIANFAKPRQMRKRETSQPL